MYMAGATYRQLAFEFGVSWSAAVEARRRNNIPPRGPTTKRQPPKDLADTIDRIGVTGARDHYSVGWMTLKRWMIDCHIKVDRTKRYSAPPQLVIPADWATVAPTMFKKELAQHYGISPKNVNRLIEETGVEAKKVVAKPKLPKQPKPPKFRRGRNPHFRVFDHRVVENTLAEQAARFLRRVYPNVHRCDILMREGSNETWGDVHGVPNKGRGYYRVGPKTMTDFEMVNYALERGMCA